MRRTVRFGVAVAAGLLAVTATGRAGRAPFLLAVLRQDGIVIPFASFDRRWRNTWPTPRADVEVPIGLDDIPPRWWPDERPRLDWMAWTSDGRPVALRVSAPAWFVAQCQTNVGLKTDYAPSGPVAAPEATPFPKDGLAIAGPREILPRVEPIAVLREDDPDWPRVAALVQEDFERAETAATREAGFGPWRAPVPQAERRRRPLVLEALYRAADERGDGALYYFEAVRRYPGSPVAPPEPERPACDRLTFGWGWVWQPAQGPVQAAVSAVASDCYRWNVGFLLPLGLLRMPEHRPLWVVQVSGWTGEAYLVVEPRPPDRERTLIRTNGGACR